MLPPTLRFGGNIPTRTRFSSTRKQFNIKRNHKSGKKRKSLRRTVQKVNDTTLISELCNSGVAGPQIVRGRFLSKLMWVHCGFKNVFVVYLDIVNTTLTFWKNLPRQMWFSFKFTPLIFSKATIPPESLTVY